MTRKDVVAKYSPNDINENNKGGVYGCPYENRYSDFLFVTEKECVCVAASKLKALFQQKHVRNVGIQKSIEPEF